MRSDKSTTGQSQTNATHVFRCAPFVLLLSTIITFNFKVCGTLPRTLTMHVVKIPGLKSVDQSRIFPALVTNSRDYSSSKANLNCSAQVRSKFVFGSSAENHLLTDRPAACSNTTPLLKRCLYLHRLSKRSRKAYL